MKPTVVIIGGGLGGLFTGAILAKEGFQVTVLEKNANIGGGLQSFTRFGETFDTGMHVVGGMQPGGNIRRICNYLGVLDKMMLCDVDDDCSDLLYFAEDKKHYAIAKGRQGFVDSLAQHFPHERENLQRYVDAIFSLTEKVDAFNLRPESVISIMPDVPNFLMAANDYIATFIGDPKLRSIIAYMNPLYGGRENCTPAYIHAIISVLYICGTSRFVDGTGRFALTLADVIRDNGGQVIAGDAATWVEVNDRMIDHVDTASGARYTAQHYISAIHPCALMRIMDEKALPKAYRSRLDSIPNAYSAFSLYIKLKPGTFPYINRSEYYMGRYDDIWQFERADKPWPLGFLFMTPPDVRQGQYASKVLLTAPMPFDMVRRWENTTTGRRGDDYLAWKREMAQRLLARIDEMHPGFERCIDKMITASPLTIRDFYGVKEGSISGFSKDCRNMALSQVPIVTKIKNLLLTGQNNNLHGFCGVPLTAIKTAEALLGRNFVINKINSCAER